MKQSRYTWLLVALGLYQSGGAPIFLYQLFAAILALLATAVIRQWRCGIAYGLVAALAAVATGWAVCHRADHN